MTGAALSPQRIAVVAEPVVALRSGATRRHRLLAAPADGHGGGPAEVGLLLDRALDLAAVGMRVAVGVDTLSVIDPATLRRIELGCVDRGALPEMLTVELTEACVREHPRMAGEFVARLHAMGCAIAVTGFGTSGASVSYLRHLPISSITLDPLLTAGIETDGPTGRAVTGIVGLAAGLGMATTAARVDDGASLWILEELGVDEGHGEMFGVPGPPEALLADG